MSVPGVVKIQCVKRREGKGKIRKESQNGIEKGGKWKKKGEGGLGIKKKKE